VQRRNLSYSFTGEKITAEQLELAYAEVESRFPVLRSQGFLTCFPSHAPDESIPGYRLVLVQTGCGDIRPSTAVAELIDEKLGEFNDEYKSKIQGRRLHPMVMEVVPIADFIRHLVGADAALESQFKFLPLYPKLWESLVSHG
jgi:hypothetical protein